MTALTEMEKLEEAVADAVNEKSHWTVRLYVSEDARTESITETWSQIPIPLGWWARMCLRLAGFRVRKSKPTTPSPGRTYRIRGAGMKDGN